MRKSTQMLGFDTRDKGKWFRSTIDKVKQSVPRAGLLVFDKHSVNASPCPASSRLTPRSPFLYLR